MKLAAELLFTFLFLVTIVSASCPSAENISPCVCIDQDGYIEIQCNGRKFEDNSVHIEELKKVFDHFVKDDRILLVLKEMNFDSLSFTHFSNFDITKIEMENCNLEKAREDDVLFKGLEGSLLELDIVNTFTEDVIIKLDFRHLKRLATLELSDNQIVELNNDLFIDGPDTLSYIALSNNGFERLGDRVFANLQNLEYFSINSERLGPIRRSMLPNPANSLEELELDNIALISIPEDLFSNMPALKILSLKTNGITRIVERTFKPIWQQMEVIDLSENPIECGSSIDWIINFKTSADIHGKCYTPLKRRDVELKDLDSEE